MAVQIMAVPTRFGKESQVMPASPRRAGWLKQLARAFRQYPRLWFAVVLLLFILAAIFAPFVSPYSPLAYHPSIATQGPSLAHPLGTDDLGRDQLSRVIYGTRISLSVGIVTILLGGICGTILGLVAAYFKGWVDQLITMIVDAILSFPSIVLALAIVAALGPSIINLSIALAFVRIPIYSRIARGQTLQVATHDYVTAAVSSGTRTAKILWRHILPNIFSPLLVQATISISFAILDESVLSFLGLGVQPPTPEWGEMINAAQVYLNSDPWMMVGPALAIVLIVLSLNLLGDAVRDILDPRDQARVIAPMIDPQPVGDK
ncbi:MAG TPA: ABC transporter permease [Ktedonobacteraceae bacterium]|jgi:peptide/nickel transport system permease protein|nr:ABC transporter permease [Ktedonobacteraceae bacterium]